MLEKIKERIEIFDLLRGFFLIVIIVNHIGRWPAFYDLFTGKGWLWVSSAEGFFFISGIMLGFVRGKKDENKPLKEVFIKLFKRTILLYLLSVGTTFLFTLLGYYFVDYPGLKSGFKYMDDFNLQIYEIITLDYVYGWADVLRDYVYYVALSPFIILLLREKLWWLIVILSIYLWYKADATVYTWNWQILFFNGMIIGFYMENIKNWFKNLPKKIQTSIKLSSILFFFVTAFISSFFVHLRWDMYGTWIYNITYEYGELISPYFDKASLPIPRLILFSAWFLALFFIFSYLENKLPNKMKNFVLLLGKNSLFVFVAHSIIIFFLDLYLEKNSNLFVNFLINTFIILLIGYLIIIWNKLIKFYKDKFINFNH